MGYHYGPPAHRGGVSTAAMIGVSVGCLLVGMVAGCAGGLRVGAGSTKAEPAATATVTETAAPARADAGPASPKPKPTKSRLPVATIDGDGAFRVPQEVKPGTYRTGGDAGGNCYWARLRNLSGDLESIAANGNVTGRRR
jgi:hypothetical protein